MLLSDWIKKARLADGRRMTGGKFSNLTGIPPATVYRAIKYPWKGIHASTAARIIEFTNGEVTLEDLAPVPRFPRLPKQKAGDQAGVA